MVEIFKDGKLDFSYKADLKNILNFLKPFVKEFHQVIQRMDEIKLYFKLINMFI